MIKTKCNFYIWGGGIYIQKAFTLKVVLCTYSLTYDDLNANIWNSNSYDYPLLTVMDIAWQLTQWKIYVHNFGLVLQYIYVYSPYFLFNSSTVMIKLHTPKLEHTQNKKQIYASSGQKIPVLLVCKIQKNTMHCHFAKFLATFLHAYLWFCTYVSPQTT
jgi:hypothetical protein